MLIWPALVVPMITTSPSGFSGNSLALFAQLIGQKLGLETAAPIAWLACRARSAKASAPAAQMIAPATLAEQMAPTTGAAIAI